MADNFDDAKSKAKHLDIVKEKKMHIDGMQLIEAVNGYSIVLEATESLNGQDKISTNKFRELASKPNK